MNRLEKYQRRKALAERNYITRLNEAKREMGEAFTIYEQELADALKEYQTSNLSAPKKLNSEG